MRGGFVRKKFGHPDLKKVTEFEMGRDNRMSFSVKCLKNFWDGK